MYLLPGEKYQVPIKGCGEKIKSYLTLADLRLPILKSVVITNEELSKLKEGEKHRIEEQLKSHQTMLRYIYKSSFHKVRNGGKIVDIGKESLLAERESQADMWLLEPSAREHNRYCCNICLDRDQMNLHIEILGRGFDISDINKGKLRPHEIIDIPYPICYGEYGDWWKWADFYFCTQEEYEESVNVRKRRLRMLESDGEVIFDRKFQPADQELLKRIFMMIKKIESNWEWKRTRFYNLSCSFELGGRVICWDIQTPGGKVEAYC